MKIFLRFFHNPQVDLFFPDYPHPSLGHHLPYSGSTLFLSIARYRRTFLRKNLFFPPLYHSLCKFLFPNFTHFICVVCSLLSSVIFKLIILFMRFFCLLVFKIGSFVRDQCCFGMALLKNLQNMPASRYRPICSHFQRFNSYFHRP